MTGALLVEGDGPVTRCALCARPASGPCARCRRSVCADCCELTAGGAATFALCLTCVRAGTGLRRAWTGLVLWLAAIVIGLAAIGVGLWWLAQ